MNKYSTFFLIALILMAGSSLVSAQVDPDTAAKASVDRFSADAGNLFVRDGSKGLPGPNEPIDFDQGPFITKGLGPNGELISYYNFDVMSLEPAPIYVLFRDGESAPVEGQLNIVDVFVNCDQNSLLYTVKPVGKGSCHTKDKSGQTRPGCYYRKISGDQLESI